jgi:hypothetical protein
MVMETGPSDSARLSSAEAAGAEEAVEAAELDAAELPPQAARRPAAPTAPVTFMKSRREIALLIFVLLLNTENIISNGGSAHTPLYTIMITKQQPKRKTQIADI